MTKLFTLDLTPIGGGAVAKTWTVVLRSDVNGDDLDAFDDDVIVVKQTDDPFRDFENEVATAIQRTLA